MAEDAGATPKAKEGKKGKLKGWQYAAIVGAAGVVYYLYKQHVANSAATSATSAGAIDPLTGQPYADEVGTNAIDPATGQTYASELAAAGALTGTGAIDPATGQSYQSELSAANALTGANAIDPSTGQTYASELQQALAAANNVISGGSGQGYSSPPPSATPTPPSPSTPSSGTTLAQWKAAVAAQLKKIRPQLTDQQVANIINGYVGGKTLPDPASGTWLKEAIGKVGTAPVSGGSALPIKIASVKSSVKTVVKEVASATVHVATPKGNTAKPTPVAKKKSSPKVTKAPEVELIPNPPSTDRLPVR